MNWRIDVVLMAAVTVAAGPPLAAEETRQPVGFDRGMTELSLWGALDTRAGDEAWLWLSGDVGFLSNRFSAIQ